MSWNYRIIRKKNVPIEGIETDLYTFEIHEVYYDNDKPTSWSEDPIHPCGTNFRDLWNDLFAMTAAISRSVLEIYEEDGKECLREVGFKDKNLIGSVRQAGEFGPSYRVLSIDDEIARVYFIESQKEGTLPLAAVCLDPKKEDPKS